MGKRDTHTMDALSALWNRLWVMQRLIEDCENTEEHRADELGVVAANLNSLEKHCDRVKELIAIKRETLGS